MKGLLRNFLINLGALWVTTQILPALIITNDFKGLVMATTAFMLVNILVVPLLKILFLPLNLLTLGIFAWLSNVLALYFLVTTIPVFEIHPFEFSGFFYNGFTIPPADLTTFQVAIVASFLIGGIIHLLNWLVK